MLTGAGAGRAGAAQLYRKLRAALVQNMLSQVRAKRDAACPISTG